MSQNNKSGCLPWIILWMGLMGFVFAGFCLGRGNADAAVGWFVAAVLMAVLSEL